MRLLRYTVLTAVIICGICLSRPSAAQSPISRPDTGLALTDDMRLLDRQLLERSRGALEYSGNTFFAFALYVADTTPPVVLEVGPPHYIEQRIPTVHRDTLRSAMRTHLRSESGRTVGIIVDSIAGPIEEAVDGVDGPDFPRRAITEFEDVNGRCRRVEREYHFAKDPDGDGAFGKVEFGPPVISTCVPIGYWPTDSVKNEVVPTRPHLVTPIVRDLAISSLGVYFVITGDLKGRMTIYDDSIVVLFDQLVAARQLPNETGLVTLDSVRVGVGIGDEHSWTPIDDSRALRIGRRLAPHSSIVRRNVRFVLPHQRRELDDSAWVVVTFHLTRGRRGEPGYRTDATTYAHSEKGVLAEKREEQ